MLERDVAPGVHRVEDANVNWYLVEGEGGITVVDAGVPTSWASLESALREIGGSLGDLKALVLTHAHFDHMGMAERIRLELGVPVWVHENDVLLTRKPRQYGRERSPLVYVATQPQALPIIAGFLSTRAFWPTPIKGVERFQRGVLPVPGAPHVVFTPGHTLGHVSLHLPERDAVIAGDAVVTLNPYTAAHGPQIVARAANCDSERALASLTALAETGVRTVLPGHGPVWRDGVERAVELARSAGIS